MTARDGGGHLASKGLSMDLMEHTATRMDYALERQMMLSDGVFSFAMTLLAVDLRAPPGWDHTVSDLFVRGWPQFFAYGMSFFAISIFWATHRQSFGRFRRSDFMLTVLGLLTLGAVTLIPFSTRLYSEDMMRPATANGAMRVYLGAFTAASVFSALTWGYACLKPGMVDAGVGPCAKVVVFLLTLTATPLMTVMGTMVGVSRNPASFAILGVFGVAIGFIRRWASRADTAERLKA